LRTRQLLLAALVLLAAGRTAEAQSMFTASIGNVYGGDAPQKQGIYALAVGGGGAHGIGSELEFANSGHFFDTPDGLRKGRMLTLMASVFVMVPVNRVRPYAIFGFGFIRERSETTTGGLLTSLSNKDVGYSAGGGVTFQFARRAGVRADLRHFKVRTSNGVSFQRLLVGIVLGG
jgi:outer membrane protein with beta-barrel domain